MIDLDSGKITRGGKEETIARFEVWWMTPWGMCETYPEMVDLMREKDAPIEFTVSPVPVAIGENGLTEPLVTRGS
jgi:hypothetical protein